MLQQGGELSTVYKITRHSATVKRKDGSIITTECEQADRWVEHFCEVLNHPYEEWKSPGIDSIHAEISKADLNTAS